MAVKMRLARRGRKRLALYDIVVADARSPRDGRFIEKLGNYNPNTHPATVQLEEEAALQWLLRGAQPTHTVRTILSSQGVLLRKHLQLGVDKGAIAQADADQKLEAWKQGKVQQQTKPEKEIAEKSETTHTARQQKTTQETKKEKGHQAARVLPTESAGPEQASQSDAQQAVSTVISEDGNGSRM